MRDDRGFRLEASTHLINASGRRSLRNYFRIADSPETTPAKENAFALSGTALLCEEVCYTFIQEPARE